MAADKSGNVYAVGYTYDANGNGTSYLREKPAGSAAWSTVATTNGGFGGVAFDAAGDVFVTGANSSHYFATWEIMKGTTTLKQIDVDTAAVGGGYALTVDGSGNIYAVGIDRTKYKNSSDPKWTVRKGTFANGKWSFSTVDQLLQSQGFAQGGFPEGVTVAPTGLYVVGSYNGTWIIRKSVTGASGTWATVDSISSGWAEGVATDAAGNIYAVGSASGWVVRESTNGGASWTAVDSFALGPNTSTWANAITRDASGNMVVAGWDQDTAGDTHAVVRTNAFGSWTTLDNYGYPDGGVEYDAVAVDSSGNLYAGGDIWDNAETFDNWIIRSQPAAPTNLTAAADPVSPTSQINLTWANTACSDQTGFAIYRSSDGGATFSLAATVGAGVTAYSDTGLTAGTTYSYYVISLLNSDGSSNPSNSAAATTLAQ